MRATPVTRHRAAAPPTTGRLPQLEPTSSEVRYHAALTIKSGRPPSPSVRPSHCAANVKSLHTLLKPVLSIFLRLFCDFSLSLSIYIFLFPFLSLTFTSHSFTDTLVLRACAFLALYKVSKLRPPRPPKQLPPTRTEGMPLAEREGHRTTETRQSNRSAAVCRDVTAGCHCQSTD